MSANWFLRKCSDLREEAKRYLKQQLNDQAWKGFNRDPSKPLRVVCPGAGLLPSLSVLLDAFKQKGFKHIIIQCVDPLQSAAFENFCAFHGGHLSNDYCVTVALKRNKETIDSAVIDEGSADQLQVTVELHQKDIYQFMREAQVECHLVYYEHPPIEPLNHMFPSLGDHIDFRSSVALLSKMLAPGALVWANCKTFVESFTMKDLLSYALPLQWNAHTWSINTLFGNLNYRNFQAASVQGTHNIFAPTPAEKKLRLKKDLMIKLSTLYYLVFASVAVGVTLWSDGVDYQRLVTLQASPEEWRNFAKCLITLTQLMGCRVGLQGFAWNLGLASMQLAFVAQEQGPLAETVRNLVPGFGR